MTDPRGESARYEMGDRVVDRGIALFLAGGVNVGLVLIWWPLWLLGAALSVWLGLRFLNAVGDLTFDANGRSTER